MKKNESIERSIRTLPPVLTNMKSSLNSKVKSGNFTFKCHVLLFCEHICSSVEYAQIYFLPNQEMCLGLEGTVETADSKRELKIRVPVYTWEFHYQAIFSDPKIPLHTKN